jgi:hypothetical protein
MAKHHNLSSHGHISNEGGVMAGGKGMSPRKAMASGMTSDGGSFGVKNYASEHGSPETHPDAKAMTGAKPALEDHERGIGDSIHHAKNHFPAQASPDHGPTHPGGHGMHEGYKDEV